MKYIVRKKLVSVKRGELYIILTKIREKCNEGRKYLNFPPLEKQTVLNIVRSVKGKIVTNRVKASHLAHIFLRPYKAN